MLACFNRQALLTPASSQPQIHDVPPPIPERGQLACESWVTACRSGGRNSSVLAGYTRFGFCFPSDATVPIPAAVLNQAQGLESGTDSDPSEEQHDQPSSSARPQ